MADTRFVPADHRRLLLDGLRGRAEGKAVLQERKRRRDNLRPLQATPALPEPANSSQGSRDAHCQRTVYIGVVFDPASILVFIDVSRPFGQRENLEHTFL